jgi:hypothetical protein
LENLKAMIQDLNELLTFQPEQTTDRPALTLMTGYSKKHGTKVIVSLGCVAWVSLASQSEGTWEHMSLPPSNEQQQLELIQWLMNWGFHDLRIQRL